MESRNRERCQKAPSFTLSLAVIQTPAGLVSCPKEVTTSGTATQLGRDIGQGSKKSHHRRVAKASAEPPPPVQDLALPPTAFLKHLVDGQDMPFRACYGRNQHQCLQVINGGTHNVRQEPSSK